MAALRGEAHVAGTVRRASFDLSEPLIFEVLTDSGGRQTNLLAKLSTLEKLLRVAPPLRKILAYELADLRPWSANVNLGSVEVASIRVNQQALEGEENWWREEAAPSFRQLLRTANRLFPALRDVSQGGPRDAVNGLLERVRRNQDSVVNTVFDMSRAGRGPDPESIDQSWALFRWTQVRLYAVIDGYWRWGPHEETTSKSFLNDLIDLPYLVLALLFGGLLTEERRLIDWFDQLL